MENRQRFAISSCDFRNRNRSFLRESSQKSLVMNWSLASFISEKKVHKNKQICGIVPGLEGWQEYVYMLSFWGRRHINQIPPKSRDSPVKKCLCVFSLFRHFLRGSPSQGVGHAIACGYGCGNGGEGSCGAWRGFCGSAPQYGQGQGERGGTHRNTHTQEHTGTYTRMLHLPLKSDLPLW